MTDIKSRISSAVSAAVKSNASGTPIYASETALLLQKNKEIQEEQATLDERRVSYKEEIDMLEEREQILQKQKEDHEAARVRFDRFTRENDEKRRVALSRMHEERDAESRLRTVLVQVKSVEKAARMRLKCLMDELTEMKEYEQFLVQVAANSEEFPSADSILSRFENLTQTKFNLIGKLNDAMREEEEQKATASEEVYKRRGVKTVLQQEQARIITEIDSDSEKLAQEMNSAGQEIAMEKKKVDVGEVMLGIDNLYNRVCEISLLTKTDMRLETLADLSPEEAIRYKVKVISDVIGDLAALELDCLGNGVIMNE